MHASVPGALVAARRQACRNWPYASHAILSMVPVERRGLGTLAVDQWFRLYYDPDFVRNSPSHELVAIVMHEVGHLLLKHHKRGNRFIATNDSPGWQRWNVATDCAVNGLVTGSGASLPENCVTARSLDMDPDLCAEAYYRLLKAREDEQAKQDEQSSTEDSDDEQEEGEPVADDREEDNDPGGGEQSDGDGPCQDVDEDPPGEPQGSDNQGNGRDDNPKSGQTGTGDGQHEEADNADGATDPGDCGPDNGAGGDSQGQWDGQPVEPGTSGSCSDGQQRLWELPPPKGDGDQDGEDGSGQSTEEAPGLDEWEQNVLIKDAAEKLAKSKGNAPGGWQQMIDDFTEPKIDPRRLLMKAVSRVAGNLTKGSGRFSYRRPSRRPCGGGLIRPRSFMPVPRILVIVDTSGSMEADDLRLAVGLVAKVLNSLRLRDGIHVICGDTKVAWEEQVFDPSKIELRGRGGTNMTAIIVEAASKKPCERPELIICVTDGGTEWPKDPLGIPLVACITPNEGTRYFIEAYPPPPWIERIDLV